MNLPHLALLHHFGNESVLLEKVGGGEALAARVAIGLMQSHQALADQDEVRQQRLEAQMMNERFRELFARQMQPVQQGARHTHAPMILGVGHQQQGMGVPMGYSGDDIPLGMDEGMVRMASAIGADLAELALEKDAGMGQMLGGVGKAVAGGVKGIGGALGGVGKAVTNATNQLGATGRLTKAMNGGMPLPKPPPTPGMFSTAQGRFNQAAKNLGVSVPQQPGMLGNAKAKVQGAVQQATPAGRATNRMNAAGAAHDAGAAAPVVAGAAPAVGGAAAAAKTPAAAAGAAGAGAPDALGAAWKRTGLSGGAWKWKVPALAAGALGAYGLYRGAKAGFNALGAEQEPQQYNAGGSNPAYGVNQYGVPDRTTPFMT